MLTTFDRYIFLYRVAFRKCKRERERDIKVRRVRGKEGERERNIDRRVRRVRVRAREWEGGPEGERETGRLEG